MPMAIASLVFATLSTGAAFRSAWLWYRSSKVEIVPLWVKLGQIEPVGGSDTDWTVGILEAAQKGAAINRAAAIWTGTATALGALATVAGALFQ